MNESRNFSGVFTRLMKDHPDIEHLILSLHRKFFVRMMPERQKGADDFHQSIPVEHKDAAETTTRLVLEDISHGRVPHVFFEGSRYYGPRAVLATPERVNHHWSMDFVSGSLNNNRRFRILLVVDDFSKECLVLEVDHSLTGLQAITRALERLALTRELPDQITVEGVQEFKSTECSVWANQNGVKLHFIQTGMPRQNTSIERFIYKMDKCLNEHRFASLHEVQKWIESWRQVYNANLPCVLPNNWHRKDLHGALTSSWPALD